MPEDCELCDRNQECTWQLWRQCRRELLRGYEFEDDIGVVVWNEQEEARSLSTYPTCKYVQRGEINSFCLKGLQGILFWEDTARLQVGQEEERTMEERTWDYKELIGISLF